MKIVKEWLSEFVDIPKSVIDEEIARKLSLATVEVEGVSSGAGKSAWDNIVIGVVKEIVPHPNADRLRIVLADIGQAESVRIVCGGNNISPGMSVAVALPGASVRWHGEGESIILQKTTIRGVQSDGMICASSEIGLGDRFPVKDDHEILDCSAVSTAPGVSLAKIFDTDNEVVFEIDNKSLSNRPDLWGHRGMAREIAALFHLVFKESSLQKIKHGKGKPLTVDVQDSTGCPRYMGVVIEGVSPVASPEWMQKRLMLAGTRPINILVDVTNYVMLEYGQPMHAFDYDALRGSQSGETHIIVRRARDGEKIEALDGRAYTLTSDMLIIADEHNPLAVAGVIGGVRSSVNDKTQTIVLEAANFNGSSIRRTSNALGVATESARRFEKHLDSELPVLALARAASILQSLFPRARVMSTVVDRYVKPTPTKPVTITVDMIERIVGVSISLARASGILKSLGFVATKTQGSLSVRIPSFRRKDISLVEDVAEELLRFIGYDTVAPVLPSMPISEPVRDIQRSWIREMRRRLAYQYGFHEAYLYAFSRKEVIGACGLDPRAHLELANPVSDERPFLCQSLLPNLLEAVVSNQQKEKTVALFEIARVFIKDSTVRDPSGDASLDIPNQPTHFACAYSSKEDGNHFAFVRVVVVQMCADLGVPLDVRKESEKGTLFAKGRSAGLYCRSVRVGTIGDVSSRTRDMLGIDNAVSVCEIDIDALSQCQPVQVRYCSPLAFPSVKRDITFVVDESRVYAEIVSSLLDAHALVTFVEPLDIYRNEKIGKDKKSFSLRLTYQLPDRTLTSREVDEAHAGVVSMVEKKWGATLR
ncbi:MAG: phenylalanine--tRNA ligase subunit beta [Candidatus Uhrbacteria bacterium]|nr:phenylalanine--tRNA ligase subunit beta [Candidatus Uhrbacteria bacterium]